MASKASKKPHYVNNKEFLGAMVEWNKTFDLEKGDQVPPVTNYIAHPVPNLFILFLITYAASSV